MRSRSYGDEMSFAEEEFDGSAGDYRDAVFSDDEFESSMDSRYGMNN
jgi:hypothetical protein